MVSGRLARRLIPLGIVLLASAGWIGGPRALRGLDFFAVRTVEVTGTRFVEPYRVVRAAGLDESASVFDDPAAWRLGALTLPLVDRIEIVRQLPSTIVLRVHEAEPVALVSAPVLRPVADDGRLLPIEPAGQVLDLPIVQGAEVVGGQLTAAGVAALEALDRLREEAPGLAARVSQLAIEGDALRLIFRDRSTEALLPVVPSAMQLEQLRLAYADLAARGELDRVQRIDLRFRDQVVVSFHTGPVI